jgi:hypothetical protein
MHTTSRRRIVDRRSVPLLVRREARILDSRVETPECLLQLAGEIDGPSPSR